MYRNAGTYSPSITIYLSNTFAIFSANTFRFHISNGIAIIQPQKYSTSSFSMANTITTMHIIMHTMWLMKFRIPMYFFIVDFSYSNETFNAKILIVIIRRDGSSSINIFIYFYNNIIIIELIWFCRNKTGGVQVQSKTPGFIYNRSPLLNIYTTIYYLHLKLK